VAGVGFTSSRELSEAEVKFIREDLERLAEALPKVRRWITGACIGGDSVIGRKMVQLRPDDEHLVIIPADHSRVEFWWEHPTFYGKAIHLEDMSSGTTYKHRNEEIVSESSGLVGYPLYPEDDYRSKRSGTWQTIRMARAAKVATRIVVLRKPD
jgi:hypothetical protein